MKNNVEAFEENYVPGKSFDDALDPIARIKELWGTVKDFVKHRIIWSQLATLIAFLFITVMGLIKVIRLLYGV